MVTTTTPPDRVVLTANAVAACIPKLVQGSELTCATCTGADDEHGVK